MYVDPVFSFQLLLGIVCLYSCLVFDAVLASVVQVNFVCKMSSNNTASRHPPGAPADDRPYLHPLTVGGLADTKMSNCVAGDICC